MDRFIIDPKDYRSNTTYLVLLIVFGSVILAFITVAAFYKFWGLSVFATLLFLIVPYTIYTRNSVDILEADRCGLIISNSKKPNEVIKISCDSPVELTLEWHENRKDQEHGMETISSLNLWDRAAGYRRRHILGLWISQEDREQVFYELLEFLEQRNYQVKSKNEVSKNNKANKSDLTDRLPR